MGAALTYLSEGPVTTVHVEKQSWKSTTEVTAAAASMQGWRRAMEDAHFLIHNPEMNVYLFGVFDGHGGSGVSQYCAQRLPELLFANEHFKTRQFDVALHEVFLDLDLETQTPAVQEQLASLHAESRNKVSEADLRKVEMHIAFETLLELVLGNPMDPIHRPPDPFRVFEDDYCIPNPFEIDLPIVGSLEVPPSSDENSSVKKRKRRSATLRFGNKPAQFTAEPNSVWGGIASRVRQCVVDGVGDLDSKIFLADMQKLFAKAHGEGNVLMHAKSSVDWNNHKAILEDPISLLFDGPLVRCFHRTANCATPWVYSIHPFDFLAALDANFHGNDQTRSIAHDQGCTANVCLLSMNESPHPVIYCANAGDSRAILVRQGRAVPLSIDHKPSLPGERRRVLHAGGRVIGKMDPRVQGDLNLSRAIGDWRHKQNAALPIELQMISPRPDISITQIEPTRDGGAVHIVLGCDGIWERLSSADTAALVNDLVHHGSPPDLGTVCTQICASTIRKESEFPGVPVGVTVGCDNMSVILVTVQVGQSLGHAESPPANTLPIISYGAQVPEGWRPKKRLRKISSSQQ